jgi:hypothetical protein
MTVQSLRCRHTGAALTGGHSWTMHLRGGPAGSLTDKLGPCVVNSSQQSCTVSGAAAYAGTDVLTLRVLASSGAGLPADRNMVCTATVGY